MFCSNCGKQLADGSRFCDNCGAQVGAPAAAAPAVPAEPNPMFKNFLATVLGFFKDGPVRTVGNAAKSSSLEWLLIAGTGFLVYALALATNVWQLLADMLGDASTYVMKHIFNYGEWLLYGLLLSGAAFFLMAGAIFFVMKVIYKKDVSIFNAFNLVAAASLPLVIACLTGIILGFIWYPLIFVLFAVALVATAILLYAGMQKMQKLEASPFVAYIAIWFVVVLTLAIVIGIAGSIAVEEATDGALGFLGGLLG